MDTQHSGKNNYLAEFIIGVGYVLFICLALALCFTVYYIFYVEPQAAPIINTFATSLPPITPTPDIAPAEQKNAGEIFKDEFDDDSHGWGGVDEVSQIKVTLGKLLFESLDQNSYTFTGCGFCPKLGSPFYLQSDFSTGKTTDRGFGIYFNYDENKNGNFYLYRINPESRKYYLYQGDNGGWSLLSAGGSSEIKPFPAVNNLGVYASGDIVELYVNGKIVDSYRQSGHVFHQGNFGFYIDGSDTTVVIDNLLITKAGDN
jgi:hypothetical protein